jgi:hypothetical protein
VRPPSPRGVSAEEACEECRRQDQERNHGSRPSLPRTYVDSEVVTRSCFLAPKDCSSAENFVQLDDA